MLPSISRFLNKLPKINPHFKMMSLISKQMSLKAKNESQNLPPYIYTLQNPKTYSNTIMKLTKYLNPLPKTFRDLKTLPLLSPTTKKLATTNQNRAEKDPPQPIRNKYP